MIAIRQAVAVVIGLSMALILWTGSAIAATRALAVVEPKYGFSFALPSGWHQIQLTKAGIRNAAATESSGNAVRDKNLLNTFAQGIGAGTKVWATGPGSGGRQPVLLVVVRSADGLPSGNAFITQAPGQIQTELTKKGTRVVTSVVHMHSGSAIEVVLISSENPVGAHTLYMRHGPNLYVVTCSSAALSTLENSWRWT